MGIIKNIQKLCVTLSSELVEESKHVLCIFLIALFPLFSLAQKEKSTIVETINGKKYYMHTVEKEQTLYSISKIYATTVNDIVIENPEAIDGIKPGQKLKIPVPKVTTAPTPPQVVKIFTKEDSIKYILVHIEKGQTLYSLSKQYSVSTNDIQKLNPEIKDGLKDGQVLKIPRNKANSSVVKVDSVKTNLTPVVGVLVDTVKILKKSEYNIALFLPFNLSSADQVDVESVVKGNSSLSAKTEVAISFYQGVSMALDSLKHRGFNCKLFVYDIDENDSAALANILKKPEMKQMDLIIGPLYYSNVKDMARFATENKIHNVSPLSQLNKILFNSPFTSKTVPSTITQVEQMTQYAVEKYSKENFILVGARTVSYTHLTLPTNREV